jgi:hypothetical protein
VRPGGSLFLDLTQKMLREGDAVLIPTRGESMSPLISGGCRLRVEPVAPHDLRLGDVILYQAGGALVAHRLMAKRQRQGRLHLITKGDTISWRFREEVDPDQVLGRVTAVRRRNGREIRIDAGWGRILSLILAAAWPLPQGLFLALATLKSRRGRSAPDFR